MLLYSDTNEEFMDIKCVIENIFYIYINHYQEMSNNFTITFMMSKNKH